MIETAYIDISGWLKVKVSGSYSEKTVRHLSRGRLQGYTSESVSYIDDSGWLKVWHENGREETIRHVGL